MSVTTPLRAPSAIVSPDLLDRIAGVRVLCVGDVMLDRFVYGGVDRVSPEAPIPVLRIQREDAMLGGAGNVARNLTALGAQVSFVSVIAGDEPGRAITQLIGDERLIEPHLIHRVDGPTTVKTRYIASGAQLLRADHETADPVDPDTAEKVAAMAEAMLADVAAIAIADYGKGALPDAALSRIIAAANARGLPVVCDPKGRRYGRYRGARIVTPNRKELAEASGAPCGTDAEIEAAARIVIADAGVDAVLATRSEEGMSLVTAEAAWRLAAEALEVFDVSGAGDTVAAVTAAALGAGAEPLEAAALANVAAGVVVAKTGTAVARPAEIATALDGGSGAAAGKVMAGADAAAERIARWRRQERRIGFTNGCFDLLHPGHIALLRQARAACDRLVVGLNDDASVARLKGPQRPLRPLDARAAVLAALADVDLVVPFVEDTPAALIEAVRPDLLVKGADYKIEDVVGGAFVQSYGGRVLLAELTPGESTTAIAEKIAQDG